MTSFFMMIGLIYLATHNFISHSELWAITSSKVFYEFSGDALILYIKPLYYFFINLLYNFELTNSDHILSVRGLFGFVAWLICVIWIRISKELKASNLESFSFIGFLFSFHVFFYNCFRVRSDILATLFASVLFLEILKMKKKPILSYGDWLVLYMLSLAAFFCTPKSIIVLAGLGLFSYLNTKDALSKLSPNIGSLLILMAPMIFLSMSFFLFPFFNPSIKSPYPRILNYFMNSFDLLTSFPAWRAVLTVIQINFIQLLLFFFSLVMVLQLPKKSVWKNIGLISIFYLISLLGFPEKWDYFIASLLPFILLPTLYLIKSTSKKIVFPTIFLLFFVSFHMTYYKGWLVPNKDQLAIIDELEDIMLVHSDEIYFDSTGILPRQKTLLRYIGPGDRSGNINSILALKTHQPTFIFYTEKLSNEAQKIKALLLKNYHHLGSDVWVLREKLNVVDKKIVSTNKVLKNRNIKNHFIYDYQPNVRYFNPIN